MKGLEPPRTRHQILSLARLPIPPHPRACIVYHTSTRLSIEKIYKNQIFDWASAGITRRQFPLFFPK